MFALGLFFILLGLPLLIGGVRLGALGYLPAGIALITSGAWRRASAGTQACAKRIVEGTLDARLTVVIDRCPTACGCSNILKLRHVDAVTGRTLQK